jgi:AAA domain, putative AbiEii toxin, Type IV TA system
MMKEVSRSKFDPLMLEAAPWSRLNTLFEKLKFNYRFKSDYEIIGISINEQPKLYTLKLDGTIDEQYTRNLSDLSDGEKTIISLCFASINSSSSTKKLLLLDELDSVLNPSLIQSFFEILKEFFVDKGVMVIMTTHSPATISLSPSNSSYYEVFKPNKSGIRISAVCRDEYSELQIANKEFYDKISDQDKRIESLTAQINSNQKILIITEGKTDWKYMLTALQHYHSKKEFMEIKEDFFYKFGSEKDVEQKICGTRDVAELSDSQLKAYLESLVKARGIDARNAQVRIGIFDSDNPKIQVVWDKEKKVFSFKIEPNDISTEFLFRDDEIKAKVDGRRLYIGCEFHPKSQKNIEDPTISLGDSNSVTNKAGERKIIESGVYDGNHENIALTKENFAQAVFNGKIKISEESWERFRHIFEKIQNLIGVKI